MTLDPSKRDGFSQVDAKFLEIIEKYGLESMLKLALGAQFAN